jgi:hypothetical protein
VASQRKREKCHAATALQVQQFGIGSQMDVNEIPDPSAAMDNLERISQERIVPEENRGLPDSKGSNLSRICVTNLKIQRA